MFHIFGFQNKNPAILCPRSMLGFAVVWFRSLNNSTFGVDRISPNSKNGISGLQTHVRVALEERYDSLQIPSLRGCARFSGRTSATCLSIVFSGRVTSHDEALRHLPTR